MQQPEEEDRRAASAAGIREGLLRQEFPGDDAKAEITRGQLLRVQQHVTQAVTESVGLAAWDRLVAVERFLTAVLVSSGPLKGHSAIDPEAAWRDLDQLPIAAER